MKITEMAIKTSQYSYGSFNAKQSYENFKYNFPELFNIIRDNYTSQKYTIEKTKIGEDVSFWLSKNDKFRGRIQGIEKGKTFIIETSEKDKSVKGFYGLMIPVLLTQYNQILSDTKLSPSAISSYEKLVKSNSYLKNKIKIKTKFGIKDFDKDILFNDINNRILIETDIFSKIFKEFDYKIKKYNKYKKINSKFKDYFNPDLEVQDIQLLGENLDKLD